MKYAFNYLLHVYNICIDILIFYIFLDLTIPSSSNSKNF